MNAAKEHLAERTIPAYIEFCQEVHAFREHCDSSQGGSEFSKKGCEWLGCSPAQLSLWDATGRRGIELFSSTKKLPASVIGLFLHLRKSDMTPPKSLWVLPRKPLARVMGTAFIF